MLSQTNKTKQVAVGSATNRFEGNIRSNTAANRHFSHGAQTANPVQLEVKPEEEELLQGKFQPIQRLGKPEEEEELLQGKFQPIQRRENNTGLPDTLKSGIENLSGLSMDNVKVHYNSAQPAQLNALAYAQGTDIHVAPGQEKHLPHEAWHVVQQAQGRVKPTLQMKGTVLVNDDKNLEKEADEMGAKALQLMGTGHAHKETYRVTI